MTPIVPLMLFGWIPISILLFNTLKPSQAILFSIIGGWLFLPLASYDFPGIPQFDKTASISISLLVGSFFSKNSIDNPSATKWSTPDIAVLIYSLSSIISSPMNGLGVYDGISKFVHSIFFILIPYTIGRKYFVSANSLNDICKAIIIGGMIYMPLCIYEIRMSPQLCSFFYGFFPHSFDQHFRYGGFRPIVFMSHGLMVSLWMAISTFTTYWMWKMKKIKTVMGLPLQLIFFSLCLTTIACKSANGWVVLTFGIAFYHILKLKSFNYTFLLLLCLILFYPILRISGALSADFLIQSADLLFDNERIASLNARLWQEDLFIAKTLEKPILGWAGSYNGWPVLEDGSKIPMIDSLWLILFNSKGFIGLFSFMTSLLIGPFIIFKTIIKNRPTKISFESILLSVIVMFFMMDCLFNGMPSPFYFLISGALYSYSKNLSVRN